MKISAQKILAIWTMILLFAAIAAAQKYEDKADKEQSAAGDQAALAAKVFDEVMATNDKAIPRELLDRAEAVAVFPGVLKAAFIFGGRGGTGIISRRTPEGWSAPVFFKLLGGSFGAQIGADKTDYIMLIQNDGGLKGLLQDKFEIGGDVGVSAGPIGREASATTTPTLDAGILAYSRSKGAFIGAALKGSRIAPDNDRNRAVYGKTAKEILSSNQVTPTPDNVRAFTDALNRYSNRRGTAIKTAAPNNQPQNDKSATRERVVPNNK